MINFNFNHFFKHSFKDTLMNLKMTFNAVRHFNAYISTDRIAHPPTEYNTVFEDNFNTKLNKTEWGYGQAWGEYHPDNLCQYYDNDGTLSYVINDKLVLDLRNNPKTWKLSETNDELTIKTGIGMVHSKEAWRYGWFEAFIQLPEGQSYWPAFWLSGKHSWPPEIDIFEAYSHDGPLYNKPRFFKWFNRPNQKIQPNLHYGSVEDGTKRMYGARDIPVMDATKRFVQYACLWEEDKIEIYYDGIKVFQCTDPKILENYNNELSHQRIVINHGLHESYPDNPDESSMYINSVKVMQK
jgi:beta-glucanase (GH16 family)